MRQIDTVRREAKSLYKKLNNWRLVGARMGITGGMAYRLANEPGYEPRGAHYRHVLGLPYLTLAPACVKCGEVHVTRRCTKVIRKAPRRVAIRCDNMNSAAKTILNNIPQDQVETLVEILSMSLGI